MENNLSYQEFDRSKIYEKLAYRSQPVSGGELTLSEDRKSMISIKAGKGYPIINHIPILIFSEAKSL